MAATVCQVTYFEHTVGDPTDKRLQRQLWTGVGNTLGLLAYFVFSWSIRMLHSQL